MDSLAEIGRLLDPFALGLVLGGALVAAVMRSGKRGLARAIAALKPLLAADPQADDEAAGLAIRRVEQIADTKGLPCVDRLATTGRFLTTAKLRLSDARSSAEFARWGAETLEDRRRRHGHAIAFWRDIADAAPAMGMLATVLGLTRMFAAMDDPARIGAPMATALVATLWGILVANLIAGPISDRLERLSEAELAWHARVLDHFTRLAERELAAPIAVPLPRRNVA